MHKQVAFLRFYRPEVDRIEFWENQNKIPVYDIFYLLKGDYSI